jgi:pheromone shutdown-related protein TraB
MASNVLQEPLIRVPLGDQNVTLLGTAHVSRASAEKVTQLLTEEPFDAVAVELCTSRHQAIMNPDALAKMDLFQVLRGGKTAMVIANLALAGYQQRLADEVGVEPGAEMRAALDAAQTNDIPVLLIDREIGTTLKRVSRNVSWWQRLNLLAGLLASAVSKESISEEEIEKLKEGDMLESALYQFAQEIPGLFSPLIEERDRYMAARLRAELQNSNFKNVLAVVGAGHLKGMAAALDKNPPPPPNENAALLSELEQIPPAGRLFKMVPWLIVLLVLAGFGLGFWRSTELGWQLVADWVLINGGLSALGALLARAHPVTVLTAFLAAPLTSLNPMIGAGMVTAVVEVLLRKPNVGDFARLKSDVVHLKGWWSNRVARILLVFLFSTIGSAIGTYVAGFRIFERLTFT